MHTWPHFLDALGDDTFARFQAFGNDPIGADAVAYLDRPYVHFVVGTYNGYLITALQLRDSALGNKDGVMLLPDDRAHLP